MANIGGSRWTDERVAELRAMAAERKSALQMSIALGPEFTRNAVIGKAKRSGIPLLCPQFRPKSDKPKPKPVPRVRKIAEPKPVVVFAPEPEPEPVVITPHTAALVSLMDLKSDMCRWPIGDVGEDDFGFCGAHAPGDSPYCCEHRLIAYTGKATPKLPKTFRLQFLGTMMHEAAE